MPRGRHRHSPPLHRLLPPSTVIGVSLACGAGALLTGDPVTLRVLVAAAAAAAVTGAVLMRSWDRAAGRNVAELRRARVRDEWRTEEHIAELETDLDEARELRVGLEGKLRAKRSELARLRNEHAGLLRRYATAETERASALEGRRLLAIEASGAIPALPARAGDRAPDGAPTPAAYLRAAEALRKLARNGARQQGRRTVEEARRRDIEQREAEEPRGKHAAADRPGNGGPLTATAEAPVVREHHTVPAASAVAPYTTPRRGAASRAQGGFDFFGAQSARAAQQRPELTAAASEDDLADVVGAEAFAEHEAREAGGTRKAAPEAERQPGKRQPKKVRRQKPQEQGGLREPSELHDVPEPRELPELHGFQGDDQRQPEHRSQKHAASEVIDLTEHDQTEQLDMRELRAHTS